MSNGPLGAGHWSLVFERGDVVGVTRNWGLGRVYGASGFVDVREQVRNGSTMGFSKATGREQITKIARPMVRNNQLGDIQASASSVLKIG